MRLYVRLYKRDFTTPLALPEVEFQVQRYSWHRMGGPELVEVRVFGPAWALWELGNWLRAPVEIVDERGTPVWWGFLSEMTIGVGPEELGLTLASMSNRVMVQYEDQSDGGAAIKMFTAWVQDDYSVATYGKFELVSKISGDLTLATAEQTRLLALYKYPGSAMRHSGGQTELSGTMRCRGWWFAFALEYYRNKAVEAAETSAQMATIAGQAQWITDTDVQVSTGLMASQYRDGTERMLDILQALINAGMDDGDALVANVSVDRVFGVWEEPTADALFLGADGTVTDTWGNPLLNHECPVAQWVALRDVVPPVVGTTVLAPFDRFFVERAEYTAGDGRWIPEPRATDASWRTNQEAGMGVVGATLFVGRYEGPHAGLFRFQNEEDDTWSVLLQVSDTANVPFLSAGERNFKANSQWMKLGYEGKSQIYLAPSTATSADPEQHNNVRLGGTDHYTEIEEDGTLEFVGNATVWEDCNVGGVQLGQGATAPDLVNVDSSGIYLYGFDGTATTEQLFGSIEIPHSYKNGTAITFHIHWMPTTADAGDVKWQLTYVIQGAGEAFTDTTMSVVDAAGGTACVEQRADFTPIAGTGLAMGDQVSFRLFRDPGDGADTYEHDAVIITVGFHFESDTVGSRQITTK